MHLRQVTAVAFARPMPSPVVPPDTAVKWRGLLQTRVQTPIVVAAGEGHRWGCAHLCADLPVPAEGDSLDEGLLWERSHECDGNADDASSEEGWSNDSDQQDTRGGTPTHFALCITALKVCGCQQKKTEVMATALNHNVVVLAFTKTRSQPSARLGGRRRPRPMGVRGR